MMSRSSTKITATLVIVSLVNGTGVMLTTDTVVAHGDKVAAGQSTRSESMTMSSPLAGKPH
jgi:hypothetical protein